MMAPEQGHGRYLQATVEGTPMIKAIVYIVLGALLGGFTGKFIIEQIYEKHHHARSVMKLLVFHEERLDAAAKASQCKDCLLYTSPSPRDS